MKLNEFITKAIRVPFVEKGRDYTGWDCYGLYRRGQLDVFSTELPIYLDYSSTRAYEELTRLIEAEKYRWQRVKEAEPGDAILFTVSGVPCHIAMAIDRRNALHAEEKLGTFLEPIRSPIWAKRLEGIYRRIN